MYNVVMQCRHGLMAFNHNDAYIGRSLELYGEYSQFEIHLFEQIVQSGDTVIEVGANIGAHTLRLAQLTGPSGSVHAFEPLRLVYQTLCANLALNSIKNAYCYQQGVGSADGELSIPALDYEQPGNFGGLALGTDAPWRAPGTPEGCETVPLVTLDRVFARLARLRLLKIDVEGMEREVLLGGRGLILRTRPLLYVENDRQEKAEALVTCLRSLEYDLNWHTPPLYNPGNFRGHRENVFGDIGSFNMFCVPAESPLPLKGFVPVESPFGPT
jgi:FkbM family methyltransferase